jgi:hypothetical protein
MTTFSFLSSENFPCLATVTHDDALAAEENQILVLEVELLEVADALALEVVDLGALAALAVVVGQLGLGRVPRHVHPEVRHVLIIDEVEKNSDLYHFPFSLNLGKNIEFSTP